MEDTRYVEYFESALKIDEPAGAAERLEAIRSLAAHVEAHLAPQDIPHDIRQSELELARAAAEKLIWIKQKQTG